LHTFEVKGDLSFRIADPARARFTVHLAGVDEKAFQFRVCWLFRTTMTTTTTPPPPPQQQQQYK